MDIKKLFIDENCTLIEAMSLLDKISKKILFVVEDSKLLASLTDGDIRRWLLKKGDVNATVKEVANYNPKYLKTNQRAKAKVFLIKSNIFAVPIVDDEKNISAVVFDHEEIHGSFSMDIPVIIMAGGFGTRLYPYTKILPKPLIPIGDIPIVEHIINRFASYGLNSFSLILNHKKNMIKAYFNEIEKEYELTYIDEDIPLGTGGGLSLLKEKIDTTFILTNCDILIEEDYSAIYKHHVENKNLITMVCSFKHIKIPYGVVNVDDYGNIVKMTEKPELSFFTNTGMYIVDKKIVSEIEPNKKIGFPDIVQKYKDLGHKVGIYPIAEQNWMDMGQINEMENMTNRLKNHE